MKVHVFPGWRGIPGAMMRVQMRMTTNVAPCLNDQRCLLLNAELAEFLKLSTLVFKFLKVLMKNYVSSAG